MNYLDVIEVQPNQTGSGSVRLFVVLNLAPNERKELKLFDGPKIIIVDERLRNFFEQLQVKMPYQ